MAMAVRPSFISPIRIAISLLVIAGLQEPTLFAQATAALAVSATVLPDPRLALPTTTREAASAQGAIAFPAASARVAALRALTLGASRPVRPESAFPAPASPEAATLPPRGPLSAAPPRAAPKRSGRPETPPTVRITVAYTAN